jgi:hypothetical protein
MLGPGRGRAVPPSPDIHIASLIFSLLLSNSNYQRWGHGDDAVVQRETCRRPPQQQGWPLWQGRT